MKKFLNYLNSKKIVPEKVAHFNLITAFLDFPIALCYQKWTRLSFFRAF